MAPTFLDLRNIDFLLYEVLGVESLTELDYFEDHSRETFDMVIATAERLASEQLWPSFTAMDREQPVFADGKVTVHRSIKPLLAELGKGGWLGAHDSFARGGQQIPGTIMAVFRAILAGANYSASAYPMLTSGAAHLISSFAAPELVDRYLDKMYSGQWQGTMALTEPQAGSSLADLSTRATPTEAGHYLIKGQKIFISCAEHDGVDNVVNLLLASIDGSPAGIKGISLFVVPNRRPEGDDLIGNDVTCATIYHKLGYRGAPITQLSLGDAGDCRGWLVGEPNRGLKYMFQMMNEARIEVGMGAAAIASAAYHAALDYARERPQGRKATERDPTTPQLPIIEHADVKRMLLFQRAIVEGSLALLLDCSMHSDLVHAGGDAEREKHALLLDILTPIAKSYPSEMGIHSVSQGLQCLGGYGYCEEFPLEQYYRDVRIHAIHEGTTGIQGMDLLGRKVVMKGGKAVFLYLGEVAATIAAAREHDELAAMAGQLDAGLDRLKAVTQHLTGFAMKGEVDMFLADATLYLELFGIITIAWQWLKQAIAALAGQARAGVDEAFYARKLHTCRFFFAYELPKSEGLATRLLAGDGLTLKPTAELF